VCRAGYKLEAALDTFGVDVTGCVALDAGLSTGGFTDCLLQRGAARVYGIDVGYGQARAAQQRSGVLRALLKRRVCRAQVHDRIRRDPRVVVMERVNLRHLEGLPEPVDVATLDVSFISVLKVRRWARSLACACGGVLTSAMASCCQHNRCCRRCAGCCARARACWCSSSRSLKRGGARCAPERIVCHAFAFRGRMTTCRRCGQVGSGGVVRDPAVHKSVLERVVSGALRACAAPPFALRQLTE
jgi:hypothetical protein